jgi:hypothetical protein
MNIFQIRPLHDEYNGTKICNDANSRATVRKRIHRIYLAAPLDAQAGAKVQKQHLRSSRQNCSLASQRVARIAALYAEYFISNFPGAAQTELYTVSLPDTFASHFGISG